MTTPPARLCVFSTETSVAGGYIAATGLRAPSRSSTENRPPPPPISTTWTPLVALVPPASCQRMWASRAASTSSPGRVSVRIATWSAIVPVGNQRPASCPSIAATRSWRRLTDGSSPNWSSPTSARAIASRIAGVGRVTVSDRRSIGCSVGMGAA
jgi:hypothetical protein